jgi:hypothetical protein
MKKYVFFCWYSALRTSLSAELAEKFNIIVSGADLTLFNRNVYMKC